MSKYIFQNQMRIVKKFSKVNFSFNVNSIFHRFTRVEASSRENAKGGNYLLKWKQKLN